MVWRVPSLAVPDDHHLGDDGPAHIAGLAACEAVQLFVDRAGRARPGFSLTEANASAVADICRRLDGIPLAIELAAARIRVFTPAQIAAGLDQRFELLTGAPRTALPRQQTLEASVDWSYHLLTDMEQTVFRRLAVFAGGFDYDAAAQAVCGVGADPAPPGPGPAQPCWSTSPWSMSTTAAPQPATGCSKPSGTTPSGRLAAPARRRAARDRHRDHYLAFAEEAEAHLEGPGQAEWIDPACPGLSEPAGRSDL